MQIMQNGKENAEGEAILQGEWNQKSQDEIKDLMKISKRNMKALFGFNWILFSPLDPTSLKQFNFCETQ